MKKLIVIMMFMIIPISNALLIDINASNYELGSNDNITINYLIDLNKEEPTNYMINIGNYTIYNNTQIILRLNNSLNYNVSGLVSGTYPLSIVINNPSVNKLKVDAKNNITILRNLNCLINAPNNIYTIKNITISHLIIRNTGNTPLKISAYFDGALSDVSIYPQSFILNKGIKKDISLLISKPNENYNTLLVVNINNGELIKKYHINIIIPIINITMKNLLIRNSNNMTFITASLSNYGNSPANTSIIIKTFSLTNGFKTINDSVNLNPGDISNYSISFPKSSVLRFTLSYFNGSENIIIDKKLSVLSNLSFDINISKKTILLFVLLLLIIFVIYHKLFRHKRP